MAELKDVVVPDIGDFSDVPIIEVMVSPGDTVAEEDPLVTLETDKATMDVPAPFGGRVEEILVKVGDKVSEGTPILAVVELADAGAPAESASRGAVGTAVAAEASARPSAEGSAPPV